MTAADQKAIKEMNAEMLGHISTILDLKLEIIENKLDETIRQTTKTNGTVVNHAERIQKLESTNRHSVSSCPQNEIITEMRDQMITHRSIKKMLITVVTVLAALIGIFATVIAIIEKMSGL